SRESRSVSLRPRRSPRHIFVHQLPVGVLGRRGSLLAPPNHVPRIENELGFSIQDVLYDFAGDHYPGAAAGLVTSLIHPAVSAFPERVVGSACASTFSRLARRSLALRPAHSRCHQFVTRIPTASAISSPP